jgi:addiction module RelB/DinJ family antitoxin
MPETTIRSRIDSTVKKEAQALLERLGLTMSDAIRLFLYQVVLEKGLPFEIKLPDEQTREHDRWFRDQIDAAVKEADAPETLFVPHETVVKQWDAKRQALAKSAGKSKR